MKLDGKLLFDYETLLTNPNYLTAFPNTLILVPYSTFALLNNTLTAFAEDDSVSDEDKIAILGEFDALFDYIFNFKIIFDEITIERKLQSKSICLDKSKNIFLSFTGLFSENKYNLPAEVHEDRYLSDVISASLEFDCPIFTENKTLIEIIRENELPVEFIEVRK